MNSTMPDPFVASVNPGTATKRAIRRSFRSRFRSRAAAYWNPFRSDPKQAHTGSCSSEDSLSIQGAPSSSVIVPKAFSFRTESKACGVMPIVRAISSETLLTSLDCIDMSVAPTEMRSNLATMPEDSSTESFISESVEEVDYDDDDDDADSEEEVVSLTTIQLDPQSCDADDMSDISDVSDVSVCIEEDAVDIWTMPADDAPVSLPVGEI